MSARGGAAPSRIGQGSLHVDVTCNQGVIAAADVVIPVSVVPPMLGVSFSADALNFSWPVSAIGFALEQTESLTPPIQWSSVTNTPVVVGDLQTLSLQPTNGTAFYRLRWAP